MTEPECLKRKGLYRLVQCFLIAMACHPEGNVSESVCDWVSEWGKAWLTERGRAAGVTEQGRGGGRDWQNLERNRDTFPHVNLMFRTVFSGAREDATRTTRWPIPCRSTAPRYGHYTCSGVLHHGTVTIHAVEFCSTVRSLYMQWSTARGTVSHVGVVNRGRIMQEYYYPTVRFYTYPILFLWLGRKD